MPMYYPDLKSVRKTCEIMAKNEKGKEYKDIIPQTEKDLPEARRQLAKYFREIWHDEIAAIEVEKAVNKENYQKKIGEAIMFQSMGYDSNGNRRELDDF